MGAEVGTAFVHLNLPNSTVTLVRLATAMSGLRGKVLIYSSGYGSRRKPYATALVELPSSRVRALEKAMDCEALDAKGQRWTKNAEGAPG